MELVMEYGLFLAKIVTVVVAIAVVVALIANSVLSHRAPRGELRVTRLNERYKEMKDSLTAGLLAPSQQKIWRKLHKKTRKQQEKQEKASARQQDAGERKTLYVLDFKGSLDAGEVSSLREEITAVLSVAGERDRVLLRLESPGGVVYGYGLAASQLQRVRDHQIPLTVAVDKVAASGGYMMACVASEIVAAPFAILGSIGVVAQLPNFHRLLKKKHIDIELHTAGQYKRTLTLLGENTEEGREKFRETLNNTHQLFKQFVQRHRPSLDVEQVSTGEHWYGVDARQKGLVDEIATSDDLILKYMQDHEVVSVQYVRRKKLVERLTSSATESLDHWLQRYWQRGEKPLL